MKNTLEDKLKSKLKDEIAKLIINYLEETGKTQNELGDEMNISNSYISEFKTKKELCNPFRLQQMMEIFNHPLYKVFEELPNYDFIEDRYYSLFKEAQRKNIIAKDIENAIKLFDSLNLKEVELDE